MRLTVLGCRAGMPTDGVASSGYLVATGATRLLLDCGPGIATALSGVLHPGRLSGVVISHLHLDHCYDLLPLGRRILTDQLADPFAEHDLDDCHVGLHALRHALPNCGSRVRGPGATLAYTGDTGVTDALHALAADADLLLAEATLDQTDGSRHGHLSAADAARAAKTAGAAQLMLTHFPHGQVAQEARRAEAKLHFDGPVHLAAPGLTHDLV